MRKLLIFSALLTSLAAPPTYAQAVSGGQVQQTGNNLNVSSYDSNNATEQYLQRKQRDNLPGQPTDKVLLGKLGPARPATSAELTTGATVNDKTGIAIARIDQVDPDGVIVSTVTGKVKIPTDAFGHNKGGLLLDMTKAQFDQIVAKANAAS